MPDNSVRRQFPRAWRPGHSFHDVVEKPISEIEMGDFCRQAEPVGAVGRKRDLGSIAKAAKEVTDFSDGGFRENVGCVWPGADRASCVWAGVRR